ncbi:MAG: molybdopterin cofactor-binding domain-containing protein [Bacteroidales bacterium]|nr:molybdopterin cofactor-binding domain-containing protein [Bacteroidales bacterium]
MTRRSRFFDHLRKENRITSAKDGCSGQGVCGACTVEINGSAKLACRTKIKSLEGAEIVTTEGLPERFREVISRSFAHKGAVQCGFCSPGMIMRAKALHNVNPAPSRDEIIKAIKPNLCRCTGYVKIVDAIASAFEELNNDQKVLQKSLAVAGVRNEREVLPKAPSFDGLKSVPTTDASSRLAGVRCSAAVGEPYPKYMAAETALGARDFVDDMRIEGMVHGALRFSDHPRARVVSIDVSEALKSPGVLRIFTAADIPGEHKTGLIVRDWPLMIAEGGITNCLGDVLAGVVAETEAMARVAAQMIKIDCRVLEAVTDMHEAARPGAIEVHSGRSNVLETCSIRSGDADSVFARAAWLSTGIYETQRIEHAFLETETAIAMPEDDGIRLYSQGQGVYVDRKAVSEILGLPAEKVRVIQVQNGGGFGGKEDITVQGHASLFAWHLKRPVKVHLNRDESITMHPKRHPVWMEISLACDRNGKFTALRLNALGDTGAYASVGTKVMERVVGHATGAYSVPVVDIKAVTVYTNNIPSGAMRGFGVPQVTFAVESCIDELCRMGGFDRWQIRYDNSLEDGKRTATGQLLRGVGLKKTLLAVKDAFSMAKFAGLACGIKNTGVGNGMTDDSEVSVEIVSDKKIIVSHGWSEMGQGIHTMAIQVLHHETGIDPAIIEVKVDTGADLPTGMTTSSRATALLGNAIIDASARIREDLAQGSLRQLAGRVYRGRYVCDWTCKPGEKTDDPAIHFAYGYATQVAILNDEGAVRKIIAAHDAGKIMNRMLFEGQIEGAVHMGMGYALTEDLPMENGRPVSLKFNDLGILRADDMPEIEVIGIEEKDPVGPYGAKGIGEIGMVSTAAAIANALCAYDGIRRTKLPLRRRDKS